ncbi:hypothetical protein C7S18_17890 [Ahniella affigens]|uniref:Zinc resistance-associated protein n=1 Tax=Ahniella affigens TaxID=2021234 RepID=A0A2P1PVQ5_9GAMM|nr:hypothetical protein [Ahniella affigens]AVP98933.1 hypothetical protein C7S18_17890 [Ahniella affigens]
MKLKLTVILLSAMLLSTAAALPPRGMAGPEPGPGRGQNQPPGPPPDLGQMLDLQGEALAKVDALSEQQHLALFRLHREQMRAERALQEQFRGELAKILNPDQLQRFEQMRAGRRSAGASLRADGQCPDRGPAAQTPAAPAAR